LLRGRSRTVSRPEYEGDGVVADTDILPIESGADVVDRDTHPRIEPPATRLEAFLST
jgi:hypothetical protein